MACNNFYTSGNRNEYPLQISCLFLYFICDVNMASVSHKIKWITSKFFKMITKEAFDKKNYGYQKTIVLDDWFRNFLTRTGNEEKWKILLRILQETGSLDRLWEAADHAHRTAVISAVEELVQSRESKPHTHTHTHTHLSTRWTFWTYFVTINLFSLYLMNFVFHAMLDAASELVLRVHYKSMKWDASFSQGSVSTIFTWGGHFFTLV